MAIVASALVVTVPPAMTNRLPSPASPTMKEPLLLSTECVPLMRDNAGTTGTRCRAFTPAVAALPASLTTNAPAPAPLTSSRDIPDRVPALYGPRRGAPGQCWQWSLRRRSLRCHPTTSWPLIRQRRSDGQLVTACGKFHNGTRIDHNLCEIGEVNAPNPVNVPAPKPQFQFESADGIDADGIAPVDDTGECRSGDRGLSDSRSLPPG